MLLRRGNAGSNTAADHITVARDALAGLPRRLRRSRSVLVRADGGGGAHEFVAWLARCRLAYSVGFTLTDDHAELIATLPKGAWTPAYDADGIPRPGAWVAELTGLLDLSGWPPWMRVLVRKERPHPGAQLRITDVEGHRYTAFATNSRRGQLATLELRHRLFRLAGRIARHARRTVVHLPGDHPWTPLAAEAINRLRALPAPG
ncbi:hypothetical protein FRAHR75_460055 [Frankia sp. Hr75.2]|nr:hypothetical protein FRAHR75_460055 [Frankia sp. Hr75.2]